MKKPYLFIPAILYMALIYFMSSQPRLLLDLPEISHADKWMHFMAYALLCFLLGMAALKNEFNRPWVWAFMVASLYGASDEIHQYFVPGRQADFYDWFADSLGALSVTLFAQIKTES
jgi:VanZ family protein